MNKTSIREIVDHSVGELNKLLVKTGCRSKVVFVWHETYQDDPAVVDMILEFSAREYGVNMEDLVGPSQKNEHAEARYLAIHNIIRICPQYSLREVAKKVGRKDHSTMISAKKKYSDLYETDRIFKRKADNVIQRIDEYIDRIRDEFKPADSRFEAEAAHGNQPQ